MILPHLIFAVSYAVYAGTYFKNGIQAGWPVYLAPAVIYFILCLGSYFLSRLEKVSFIKKFKIMSNLMYIFIIVSAAPLFIKMNLPEPHNFVLRKLELLWGAAYAFYIFLSAGYFLYRLNTKFELEKIRQKPLFVFIFSFVFVFFFAVSLWFNYANQPTGDEPEYLMMASSMAKDRDINLENNYSNRDYAVFYDKDLKPHGKYENGKLYSYHPALISAVFMPFYAVAGRMGATVFINLLSAFFVALIYYFLVMIYKENTIAVRASLLCAFSLPVFMFSNLICSEVLSGALILGALIIFLYKKEKFYAACFVAAFIPWAHPRNVLLWLALGLIVIFEYRREITKIGVFILVQALSGLLLVWFNYSHFGAIMPGAYTELKGFPGGGAAFGFNPAGIAGLFFDQEFGLFFYTPVFTLFFAGILLLYRTNRKLLYYSLCIFLPYFIMLSSYAGWNGGGGTSPRFFVPVIFLFVLFTAEALRNIRDNTAALLAKILCFAGPVISLIIFIVPWIRWNKGLGDNWILKFISGFIKIDITGLLPSFWAQDKTTWILAFLWITAVGILNIYIIKNSSKT